MEENQALLELTERMEKDRAKGREIDRVPQTCCADREGMETVLADLRALVFPGFFAEDTTQELLLRLLDRLGCRIGTAVGDARRGRELCLEFLEGLPDIRATVQTDLQAAFDGDPAATCMEEIILAYPGLYAITVQRLAHRLYGLGVPMIPRMMTEYAHSVTGIDIHPGAEIGPYFFIDHGTGIVIGETTVIGQRVKLYQGVTLGGLSTRGGQSLRGKKRHPTIGDDVTVYANASILGGDTVIGDGCVIGASAFITESVAPGSKVRGK